MTRRHTLSGGAGAFLALLLAADFVALRGEEIFQVDVPASGGPAVVVPIERTGERHTLLLRTGGKYPLEWELVDPTGFVLEQRHDYTSKKGVRRHSFVPREAGDYRVRVKHRGSLASPWSRIDVSMRVNDRRTISAWLDFR